jgi:hypothetical protein
MKPTGVQVARQAALLLGWAGEYIAPVTFLGMSCWAVASLNAEEHERRCGVGLGPVLDRAYLEDQLVTEQQQLAPPLQLVGGLVERDDPGSAIGEAALLAGYAPRAVLLDDRPSLLGTLADAAVLDVGVIVNAGSRPQLLSPAGPRVPGGRFDAREWLLLESVYAAILMGVATTSAA